MLGRPPPWLALPPLLAISRCFSALIAAKPRFEPPEPPLFEPAISVSCLLAKLHQQNAARADPFTSLIEVSNKGRHPAARRSGSRNDVGGEGGIRTHGTVAHTPHFECGAFDHSATSPRM